jgi:hypothetical protein
LNDLTAKRELFTNIFLALYSGRRRMTFLSQCRIVFRSCIVICFVSILIADDHSLQLPAERPFIVLYASNIDNPLSICELRFDSVERSDLAVSLDGRSACYNGLFGINRDKPPGMMFNWCDETSAQVVFLPVVEINDLLMIC